MCGIDIGITATWTWTRDSEMDITCLCKTNIDVSFFLVSRGWGGDLEKFSWNGASKDML